MVFPFVPVMPTISSSRVGWRNSVALMAASASLVAVSSADLVHVAFLELGQGGVRIRTQQAVRIKFFYGDLIFFDDLQIFVVRNF